MLPLVDAGHGLLQARAAHIHGDHVDRLEVLERPDVEELVGWASCVDRSNPPISLQLFVNVVVSRHKIGTACQQAIVKGIVFYRRVRLRPDYENNV